MGKNNIDISQNCVSIIRKIHNFALYSSLNRNINMNINLLWG